MDAPALTEDTKLRFSSSVAARRIRCPGSAKAEAIAPPLGESVYSAEGSALHDVMECVVEDYFEGRESQIDFSGYVGETIKGVAIDEDMADGAQTAFGLFKELEETYGLNKAEVIYLETEVPYPDIPDQRTIIDFVCETPELIFILDWKFGKGFDVDAVYNEQLAYNAVAVIEELFPESKHKRIVSAIVQPWGREGGPKKVWEPTAKDLDDFRAKFHRSYGKATSDSPKFAPGPHCQWCSANGTTCALIQAMADRLAGMQPGEIESQLVSNLERAPVLKKALDNAAKAAHERLERGEPLPGWKLVAKRAARAWKDAKNAAAWGRRQGLKKKDMFEEKFVSPAGMEKLVGKDKPVPDRYIDTPFTGTTIAPDSDRRPALKPRRQRAAGIEAKLAASKEEKGTE